MCRISRFVDSRSDLDNSLLFCCCILSSRLIKFIVFIIHTGSTAKTTREVFDCLLESIRESQEFILEVNGHLTTLTVCVILPVETDDDDNSVGDEKEKFVVCACNVGDSLGYVYGKNGVREFTQGELERYEICMVDIANTKC